jgi:hypothetical protein
MPQTEAADERDTPAVNLSQLTESSRLCEREREVGEREVLLTIKN